jgi:hypothetical protein
VAAIAGCDKSDTTGNVATSNRIFKSFIFRTPKLPEFTPVMHGGLVFHWRFMRRSRDQFHSEKIKARSAAPILSRERKLRWAARIIELASFRLVFVLSQFVEFSAEFLALWLKQPFPSILLFVGESNRRLEFLIEDAK